MSNSSILSIDRTLSGATAAGQSRLGNDGNDGVLRIPQSSTITGASPHIGLCHLQDTRLGGGALYTSAETHSVYSTNQIKKWNKENRIFI